MDFTLTEEQRQLQDTVRRYLGREHSFEQRRKRLAADTLPSRDVWSQLAELGVLGIGIREDDGGLGGDAFDTMIVMEALGRALVVEPYLSCVVAAGLVTDAGNDAQRAAWLPAIAAGEKRLAFAHGEAAARYATSYVETRAVRQGKDWKLDGAKSVVLHGDSSDALVVSARTGGNASDRDGISLFIVDPRARGVSVHAYATQDSGRAADVTLAGVEVGDDMRLGAEGKALPFIERALDRANAALCAEAVGIIDALNEATLEYLKTRRQFGQPIGRFQALQHRMAEMTIKAVEARSMAILAAAAMSGGDAGQRVRGVSSAKAFIGQAARFVGQQAIQLHGAIGMTDELVVSHWFKRLAMIDVTFGDAEHHLGRVSDMILAEPA